MRIFAVGRNYAAHIRELENEKPDEPVIFTKPDTAIIKNNEPFFYPDHISNDIHHEVEIVIRIKKQGKQIDVDFAEQYYDEIALGVDFTARDVQSRLKEKGLPWDLAKGFNGSAPISEFVSRQLYNIDKLKFSLEVNDEVRQEGDTSLMLFSFDEIIAFLSKYFTLKPGDLIFTGTPAGVGPVHPGDTLKGFIDDQLMFDFEVK